MKDQSVSDSGSASVLEVPLNQFLDLASAVGKNIEIIRVKTDLVKFDRSIF